jgi:hypothetical protein
LTNDEKYDIISSMWRYSIMDIQQLVLVRSAIMKQRRRVAKLWDLSKQELVDCTKMDKYWEAALKQSLYNAHFNLECVERILQIAIEEAETNERINEELKRKN